MFVFLQKQHHDSFAFSFSRILKLFAREVCLADFQHILLFLNVCKHTFRISHVRISKNVKGVLMCNLQLFILCEDEYIDRFSNLH